VNLLLLVEIAFTMCTIVRTNLKILEGLNTRLKIWKMIL